MGSHLPIERGVSPLRPITFGRFPGQNPWRITAASQKHHQGMVMQDPYAVLGVTRTASREEIEAAYLIALDKANKEQGADASGHVFVIREAYQTLISPRTRHQADAVLDSDDAVKQPPEPEAPTESNQRPNTYCPQCRKSILASSRYCPHCGAEQQAGNSKAAPQSAIRAIGGLVIFGVIYWGIHSYIHREPPTFAERMQEAAKDLHKFDQEHRDPAATAARQAENQARLEEYRRKKAADKQRENVINRDMINEARLELDRLDKFSDTLIAGNNDPHVFGQHSRKYQAIQARLKLLGPAGADPYGDCAAMAIMANALWMAKLNGKLSGMSPQSMRNIESARADYANWQVKCANKL
jgi:hypothetical protein